jgi:hypothetical protein
MHPDNGISKSSKADRIAFGIRISPLFHFAFSSALAISVVLGAGLAVVCTVRRDMVDFHCSTMFAGISG